MENLPSTLLLVRKWFTDKSTVGELYLDKEFQCHTLEDTVRKEGIKVFGKTAIPSGKYEVVMTYSSRFGKFLPLLMNVPNFQGVRIHSGNRPEDTEGCILAGHYMPDVPDIVSNSRAAYASLMEKLEPRFKSGKVCIEIVGSNT